MRRRPGSRAFQAFIREALPSTAAAARELAGDLVMTTLSKVGKHVSETRPSSAEVEAYVSALADVLCGYLDSFGHA